MCSRWGPLSTRYLPPMSSTGLPVQSRMAFFAPHSLQLREFLCASEGSMRSLDHRECTTTARFRFWLLFIPWLRVPGPVFLASLTFKNNCDASAVSCVVTKFSACAAAPESVLSHKWTLATSSSFALDALARAFLALPIGLQFSCLSSTNSLSSGGQVLHNCDRFEIRYLDPCLFPSTLHRRPLVEFQSSKCSFQPRHTIVRPLLVRE